MRVRRRLAQIPGEQLRSVRAEEEGAIEVVFGRDDLVSHQDSSLGRLKINPFKGSALRVGIGIGSGGGKADDATVYRFFKREVDGKIHAIDGDDDAVTVLSVIAERLSDFEPISCSQCAVRFFEVGSVGKSLIERLVGAGGCGLEGGLPRGKLVGFRLGCRIDDWSGQFPFLKINLPPARAANPGVPINVPKITQTPSASHSQPEKLPGTNGTN